MRLVLKIAHRQRVPDGLERDDLIQNGMLGLLRAVEKFDGRKGFKFSTYASWWIKQSIHRRNDVAGPAIHIPAHAAIAERTGDSSDPVVVAARAARNPVRLDAPVADTDNQHEWHATATTPDPVEEAIRTTEAEHLRGLVDALPADQAAVMRLRYGSEPMTKAAVAERRGIPHGAVDRLERQAMTSLRETFDCRPVPVEQLPRHEIVKALRAAGYTGAVSRYSRPELVELLSEWSVNLRASA